MKLLSAALQKQDYNLAAYVLVYGLIKASAKKPKNPPSVAPLKVRGARPARRTAMAGGGVMNAGFQAPRKFYGNKRKKQEKG